MARKGKEGKELKVEIKLPPEVVRKLTKAQREKLAEVFRCALVFALDVPATAAIKAEQTWN